MTAPVRAGFPSPPACGTLAAAIQGRPGRLTTTDNEGWGESGVQGRNAADGRQRDSGTADEERYGSMQHGIAAKGKRGVQNAREEVQRSGPGVRGRPEICESYLPTVSRPFLGQ